MDTYFVSTKASNSAAPFAGEARFLEPTERSLGRTGHGVVHADDAVLQALGGAPGAGEVAREEVGSEAEGALVGSAD